MFVTKSFFKGFFIEGGSSRCERMASYLNCEKRVEKRALFRILGCVWEMMETLNH